MYTQTRSGRRGLGVTGLWAAILLGAASAFAGAQALPYHDVSSVKINRSASTSWNEDSDRQRYSAKNVSLQSILAQVWGYGLIWTRVISAGVASAHFDVEAKVFDPDPETLKKLTPGHERAMLQPMLLERFKLAVHTATRTLPVFILAVQQGKFVSKLPIQPGRRQRRSPSITKI